MARHISQGGPVPQHRRNRSIPSGWPGISAKGGRYRSIVVIVPCRADGPAYQPGGRMARHISQGGGWPGISAKGADELAYQIVPYRADGPVHQPRGADELAYQIVPYRADGPAYQPGGGRYRSIVVIVPYRADGPAYQPGGRMARHISQGGG